MAETVLYEKRGNVVLMTLNRPDALNSINRQLRRELSEAITQFDGDEDSYVGIITGAGRAFCAGRDLKERASDNAEGAQARARDSMYPDRALHVASDLETPDSGGQRLRIGRWLVHSPNVRPAPGRRGR